MKKSILTILIGLNIAVYGLLVADVRFTPAKASRSSVLDVDGVTEESVVAIGDGATAIALFAPQGVLYETNGRGAAGAVEFLAQDPVAGEDNLLPRGFQEDARTARTTEDSSGQSHYFYQQTIDGIPVYGSNLAVHQRNGNEIYSLTGNISNSSYVFRGPLDEEGARIIALDEAKKKTKAPLRIGAIEQVVFNGKALGVNENPGNMLAWAVVVEAITETDGFGEKYIIDTTSGEIAFVEGTLKQTIDRRVYDCHKTGNCRESRFEGQPVVNVADVDTAYDTSGTFYNFFADKFGRDSFDDKGSPLFAYMQYMNQTCPNAMMTRGRIYVCNGLAVTDVIAHEMTHAMNQAGPKFIYADQSGAMDEAFADIFASAMDGNYTMGEQSSLGTIRSMESPGKFGQPEQLFSRNYYCGNEDYGGVHKNGGVIAKAFYLMVNGGTFNTCTIQGVGKDVAYAVIYNATTHYMRSSSNFKDAYNAIMQSCGDLYDGINSSTCIQVRNSMRATEMDQQPEGSQKGAKCTNIQPHKPDCSQTAPPPGDPPDDPPDADPPPEEPPTQPQPTQVPGTGVKATLDLTLRFQGVFSKPNASAQQVEVVLSGTKLKKTITKTVSFEWQPNGLLKAMVDVGEIAPGDGYIVTVKPPLHLSRKICDSGPVEIFEGKYNCWNSTLHLKSGVNTVNAQGILMLAGDIPDDRGNRDGTINSVDIGVVRAGIGKNDNTLLKRADINYDGIIDQQDLNIVTLSSSIKLE